MADIDDICAKLELAFTNEKDDPISISTIISVFCDQLRDTSTEKTKFLGCLVKLLRAHPDTVYELGWDLPKPLLSLVHTGDEEGSTDLIDKINDCIKEISIHGNAKECLLTWCEILCASPTSIEGGDDPVDLNALSDFEISCKASLLIPYFMNLLTRIKTLYPSKFLGMVVSSILNFVQHSSNYIGNSHSLLAMIHDFCKSYESYQNTRPVPVAADEGVSEADLLKIVEDEKILQDKLLRSLITFSFGTCLRNYEAAKFDTYYRMDMTAKTELAFEHEREFVDICKKYLSLAKLYGIDLETELRKYASEARNIYKSALDKIDITTEEGEKQLNEAIYELSYAYFMKSGLDRTEIVSDPNGMLLLIGANYLVNSNSGFADIGINIEDGLCVYLRIATASFYSELCHNPAAESVARLLIWKALSQFGQEECRKVIEHIPASITNSFLQVLLLKSCTETSRTARDQSLSLLGVILGLTEEETTFSFAIDTLLSCPYITAKTLILTVLKNLLLRHITYTDPHVSEDQANQDKTPQRAAPAQPAKPAPPQLPPRTYIRITEDRMAAIHSLTMMAIQPIEDATLHKRPPKKADLVLLLSYLNFLTGLRHKWDRTLLQITCDKVNSVLADDVEETEPEVTCIKLANDVLRKFLSQAGGGGSSSPNERIEV